MADSGVPLLGAAKEQAQWPKCPFCHEEIHDFGNKFVNTGPFLTFITWCKNKDCAAFLGMHILGDAVEPKKKIEGARNMPRIPFNPTRRH